MASNDLGQETRPPLILETAERLPQDRISSIAERIGNFYSLSEERIANAKTTEAYVVNDDQFIDLVASSLMETKEWILHNRSTQGLEDDSWRAIVELKQGNDKYLAQNPESLKALAVSNAKIVAEKSFAATITKKDGKSFILVKDSMPESEMESALDHEMVHVLGTTGFGKGEGFRTFDPISGFINVSLDEGATEVLARHQKFPHLSLAAFSDIFLRLKGNHYQKEAELLLVAMLGAQAESNPFTFDDLARHYFSPRNSVLEDNSDNLIEDLNKRFSRRVPPGSDITMLRDMDYMDFYEE